MRQYRVLSLIVALLAAFGAPLLVRTEQAPAPAGAGAATGPFDTLHFRPMGPASMSGRIVRRRGVRAEPGDLLRRHRARRRVEDDEQRHDVRGAVPGSGADVDRRRHRVAEQSGSRVGRYRRIEQPPEHVVGRRHLQVDRRRQDVHEHGPAHVALHQPHRDRSAQQRHRVRRGDRQPVGARRRARHLQDDRRRQDLEAGAQGRRRHRRQRSGDGSRRTTRSSTRRPISAAAPRAA